MEEPKTVAEAMQGPQSKEWRLAMEEEMGAMKALGVWDANPVNLLFYYYSTSDLACITTVLVNTR